MDRLRVIVLGTDTSRSQLLTSIPDASLSVMVYSHLADVYAALRSSSADLVLVDAAHMTDDPIEAVLNMRDVHESVPIALWNAHVLSHDVQQALQQLSPKLSIDVIDQDVSRVCNEHAR